MTEDEHVAPQDAERRNSPKAASDDPKDAHMAALAAEACYWNDKKYSDGATVCDSGTRHKCWNGRWVEIGLC